MSALEKIDRAGVGRQLRLNDGQLSGNLSPIRIGSGSAKSRHSFAYQTVAGHGMDQA